jgi:flap endonuclease-1
MGIKNLNSYLIDRCSKNAIRKSQLKIAEGKTIVIDTSIYMYKYMTQNSLIEYMYLMISILLEYKITPIFVFDGKAPPEKKKLLRQRSLYKKEAEIKYNELHKEMEKSDINNEMKKDILDELECLKKKFIRIKESDINRIKRLMDAYGISYLTADGEADKLCATMVKNKKAWACLSDDMDMFVYGCPRVLRHMSLLKHTIIIYEFDIILKEVGLTENTFREIMVLAGTDYNIHQTIYLSEALKWFNEYSVFYKNVNISYSFYEWLIDIKKIVLNLDELIKVYNMFYINEIIYENHSIVHKTPNFSELKKILSEDGFISF